MLPRFLVLAAVLIIPVLLAVASQAMTRPPGPPDLPAAPIEVSFGPAAPSEAPSAGPSASPDSLEPGVIRTPRPTVADDDDEVEGTDDDD